MKRDVKQKKGISLIVLVITIIVMIILATVIILTLDSSNIIERANEAKESTNLATKKEAASVALAEYKLEVSLGNIDSSTTSANDYVRNKLEEQGIDVSDVAVYENNEVIIGSGATAINKGVKIGDYVTYSVEEKTTTKYFPFEADGTQLLDPFKTETFKWQYMGLDDNGNILIVSENPITQLSQNCTMTNFDDLCNLLYGSEIGTARSLDIDDVNNVLGYTGYKGQYISQDGTTKYLTKPLTVQELINSGEPAISFSSSSNKFTYVEASIGGNIDIFSVQSNYYTYKGSDYKGADTNEYNLIFRSGSYYLDSLCNLVRFDGNEYIYDESNDPARVVYYNRYITPTGVVGADYWSESWLNEAWNYLPIRPVVELNSSVKIGDKDTNGAWILE